MAFRTAGRAIPALAIIAAALTAAPLKADPDTDPMSESPTIRVVNNHQDRVAVYVVGEDAARHYLGTVNRFKFKEFELPMPLASGTFQVQVFPRANPAGLGAWSGSDEGIQTRPIEMAGGLALQLFVEPTLRQSIAEVAATD